MQFQVEMMAKFSMRSSFNMIVYRIWIPLNRLIRTAGCYGSVHALPDDR